MLTEIDDWNEMLTPNQWLNEEKTLEYISKVILPFIQAKREELFQPDHPALVIYDEFKGQLTDSVHSFWMLIKFMLLKFLQTVPTTYSQWIWRSTDQQRNSFARNFMFGTLSKLNRS